LCVVETLVAKTRVECLTKTLGFHDGYAVDSEGRKLGDFPKWSYSLTELSNLPAPANLPRHLVGTCCLSPRYL
jgi:hypothetical protein